MQHAVTHEQKGVISVQMALDSSVHISTRARERTAEGKAVAAATAAQGEAALACDPVARGRDRTAGAGRRAREGWDRARLAVSELPCRRFRKVFSKQRRVANERPVLAVELVGTVLWMARERCRGKERAKREATQEQDAAKTAVRQQERMQKRQERKAAAAAGEVAV